MTNLPFERLPQCACDPGTGPTPRNAEIFKLRELLGCALAEHDDHEGQFAADYMPNHWTHQARKALTPP